MNIEPGTPEFLKMIRKKLGFSIAMIMLGGLVIIGMILLIKFGGPHSDPVKTLIAFIILVYGALSLVGILSGVLMLFNAWAHARLTQLEEREKDQNKNKT